MDPKLKQILKEEKRRRREAENRHEKKNHESDDSPDTKRKSRNPSNKERERERENKEDKEKELRHRKEKERDEKEQKEKERREKEREKEEREQKEKEKEEYRRRKEKEKERRDKEKKEQEEKEQKEQMNRAAEFMQEVSVEDTKGKEESSTTFQEDPHKNLNIDDNTFMFVFEDKKGELYNDLNKITKDDKDEIKIFPVYFKGCDENLTEEVVTYDISTNKIVPQEENKETTWLSVINDPNSNIIKVPVGDIIVYNGKLFHCLHDLYDYLEYYGAEVLPLK